MNNSNEKTDNVTYIQRETALELMRNAINIKPIQCENPSGIIVFDTETTGLNFFHDEIIQISIIDGDGNELLNTYVKPYWNTEWSMASEINHIYPETVASAPYAHELIPIVRGIFASAKTLVAYNNKFDLMMLKNWGIDVRPDQVNYDVMLKFAEIYGEWNESFGNYKWQKLTKAAWYYGYIFDAHDSLEDVRATLAVYYAIKNGLQEYQWLEYQVLDNKGNIAYTSDNIVDVWDACRMVNGEQSKEKTIKKIEKNGLSLDYFINVDKPQCEEVNDIDMDFER